MPNMPTLTASGSEAEWWAQLFKMVGILGGSGGAIAIAAKAFFARSKRKDLDKMTQALHDIHEIHEAIGDALNDGPALHRALLIRVENGGGIPRPTHSVYSSVIFEQHLDPLPAIRQTWQNVMVDADQASLIHRLLQEPEVVLDRDSLDRGLNLRNIYEADGIKGAYVTPICQTPTFLIYLCAHVPDVFECTPETQAASHAAFRRSAIRIRGVLARHQKANHHADLDLLTGGGR